MTAYTTDRNGVIIYVGDEVKHNSTIYVIVSIEGRLLTIENKSTKKEVSAKLVRKAY